MMITEIVILVRDNFPDGCDQKCMDCELNRDDSMYTRMVCDMLGNLNTLST